MDKSKNLKRKLEEEIERGKEYLAGVLDEIADSEKQFEKRLSELMKIHAEVELKGKQLEQMDLDLKERSGHSESIKLLLQEHTEELALREKKYNEITEAIRKLSSELVDKEKTLERASDPIMKLDEKQRSKQKNVESTEENLQRITEDCDSRKMELLSVKDKLRECLENLEIKEREFKSLHLLITERNGQVKEGEKKKQHLDNSIESLEKKLETTSSELMKTEAEVELKGKRLEQMDVDLERHRAEVNEEMELLDKSKTQSKKQLESLEKQVYSQQKLLESLEHKLAKCVEDYELKAKQLQSLDELIRSDSPRCLDALTDVESSSAFLPNEVFAGLQAMTDPADYVLSVVEDELVAAQQRGDQLGLSEPLLKNLVLLLEELQRVVKPSDQLQANASQVANRWSSMMRSSSQVSPLEAWGFVQLTLAYGLVFRTDPYKTSTVLQGESSHQAGLKRQRLIVNHQLGDESVPSQPYAITTHPSSSQTKPNIFSGSITADMLRELLKKKPLGESEDLFSALKCTQDPAKLVLDTSMVLSPSNPEGSYEFKLLITSDNCFLLLNQMKKLIPQIGDTVKHDAKKLAVYWKDKFPMSKQCNLEVICFLEFLGIFGIVSEFKADDLLGLLNDSYWRSVSPDLCKFLGLEKAMQDFIQNLMRTGDRLKAVDYIYSLDVVHKFDSISNVIKYSLKITKEFAEKSFREAKNNCAAQVAAIDREIKTIRNAIKCIKSHKLESEFESVNLQERLNLLLKIRGNLSGGSGSKPGLTIQQSKTTKPPNVAEVGSFASKTPLEPSMVSASSSASKQSRTMINSRGKKPSLSESIQSSGQVASLTRNPSPVASLTSNGVGAFTVVPNPYCNHIQLRQPEGPRPQPQPQPQPRPQPLPQPQPRPQPLPQPRPRLQLQPQLQHRPQPQSQPRPLPQPQPRPRPQLQPQPQPLPQPQPQPQPQPRPQPQPQPRPLPQPQPQLSPFLQHLDPFFKNH